MYIIPVGRKRVNKKINISESDLDFGGNGEL
jgi:hypothetical protein